MQDRPTLRQQAAWSFAAVSALAAAGCAAIGWQWALLGGAVSAALLLLRNCLRQDMPPRTAAREAFGRMGGMIAAASAVWNLAALARLTCEAGTAFPEAEDPAAIGLITLALAALASSRGDLVPARCAGVLALVLGAAYAVLLLSGLRTVRLEWLRPGGSAHSAFVPCVMLLLPGAAGWIGLRKGRGDEKCGAGTGAAAILLLPAAAAAVTAGNLSPRLAAAEEEPFYEMVKGLTLLAAERFEPLASMTLLLGWFCAMCLLLSAACEALGAKDRRLICFLSAGAAGVGSFWAGWVPDAVWGIGAAIFWGILPLLIPLVVDCKKGGKKVKKELDKSDQV